MRKRYKPKIDHNSEFELDLAPLLAVMVKLVPVLLLSSAFMQLMVVETELPQVVQQALARQEKQTTPTVVSLSFGKKDGVLIRVNKNGADQTQQLPPAADFDYAAVYQRILALKKENPEIFRIEFRPADDVAYKEIVQMMDEVRRAKSREIQFQVRDEKTGATSSTDYMFPEVVFTNTLEG